jgi:enoyl-CoA hydratase/carnithine racemase
MNHTEISRSGDVAIVTLRRGKVNALSEAVLDELTGRFEELKSDATAAAAVLTGSGKFFSFGFDIPELLSYSKDEFVRFLRKFTTLYTELYVYPKPLVAALNGHTIAGGCMLATACDRRIMAAGGGKISLNEVTFGASVFAGSVAMLVACAGQRNAERILYSGAMYTAEEARALGLVDGVTSGEELLDQAIAEAQGLAGQDRVAFASIKALLRRPVAEEMRRREAESIREFVTIWYSEATWEQLKKIQIRR